MVTRREVWRVAVVLAATVLAATATSCVPQAPTSQGRSVKCLYDLFALIAAGIFVAVAGMILWSIVRYRRRDGDDALPPQFHTNVKLEVLWFAVPTLIVIGLFASTASVLNEVDRREADPEVEIAVEAFQWGWRFSYRDGPVVESLPGNPAEVVLPVDRAISLELTSPDVIHAFYVPRFLIKRDVVPGRTNRLDIVVEEPGTYVGRCAEFCGLLHDRMDVTIRAVAPDEFERWLASREDA